MTLPIHTLHLYQKPAVGNAFINRFPTYNYRHSIAAVGGFDTASCDIAIRSKDEGQQFLNQYIGNRVAIYVDNPVEPIWEGFINRMTFSAGNVQYSISLDEMSNRVRVNYATPTATMGTATNDTESQAVYGIKQGQFDLGYRGATPGTAVTGFRDTKLVQMAWPKSSIAEGQGSGLLHIEMLGFYHTLSWDAYSDANTTAVSLVTYLTTILLPSVANGTTFFDNTITNQVSSNTITISREKLRGQTIWDIVMEIAEIGNGTSYFVAGISPTDFQTGLRHFYYRAFNSAIEYTARQSDGLRIRNLYGQLIDPWRVRPDRGIRVSDMLIGWNGLGDNPTETYAAVIDYDANRQRASYRGDDDVTSEGAFQFRRYHKRHGQRFGAQRRVA